MSVSKENNKQAKQIAVSKAVLEVIEKDGLIGVTHSKVSRKAAVSRAWLYEYIGKEKESLIEFAAEVLGEFFTRSKKVLPKNKEQLKAQISEGTHFLFENLVDDPSVIKIYFRFRGTQNPIGKVIQKYEKNWLHTASKTVADFYKLEKDQAQMLVELAMTLRLGFAHRIVTSENPENTLKQAEIIFEMIQSLLPA